MNRRQDLIDLLHAIDNAPLFDSTNKEDPLYWKILDTLCLKEKNLAEQDLPQGLLRFVTKLHPFDEIGIDAQDLPQDLWQVVTPLEAGASAAQFGTSLDATLALFHHVLPGFYFIVGNSDRDSVVYPFFSKVWIDKESADPNEWAAYEKNSPAEALLCAMLMAMIARQP